MWRLSSGEVENSQVVQTCGHIRKINSGIVLGQLATCSECFLNISEPHGRMSVIAAITISPERRHFSFYFQLSAYNTNFRAKPVVEFIEDVRHKVRGPITLLWDRIPIHRAESVTDYFARHRRLVVEKFPPYAPELNPVDNVWSYVNYSPRNLDELRKRMTAEFYRLQNRPDLQIFFQAHRA